MILKSLKISNILSFKHLDNFDNAPNTIEFKKDLNIFIGSNGSGKSNLLEIINKLFQGHFFENYFINDNALFQQNSTEKVVKVNQERKDQVQNTLFKNFNYPEESSMLQIEITPDIGDIENLMFILSNRELFLKFCTKYCEHQKLLTSFNEITLDEIKNISPIKFLFTLNNAQGARQPQFQLSKGNETKEGNLLYHYLLYFNQIQTLIEVINLYEVQAWPLMKNPFALISAMRQYNGFSNSVSVGTGLNRQIKDANQNEANISTKNYVNTDHIFRITSIKIGQIFRQLIHKAGIDNAFKTIEKQDNAFTKINFLLKENLGFELKLENYNSGNDNIMLQIYKGKEAINFMELSMGQRSIFYLLFAVYGYDIQNGLLIIDEPELHLHVTMQKKYFSIIKDICKKAKIQIFIATHSSIFIDENTIKNTFRFYKDRNHSSIVCPTNINQPQKDLIKILTYTNSSRIFFSDNVLLVEGDSDEYFFNYFYQNYVKNKIKAQFDIEILYIGGKGNFEKWRIFLALFRINSFFIGDFDNIKDFGIVGKTHIDLKELIDKSKEHIISKFVKEKISKKVTKDGAELLKQIDTIIKNGFVIEENNKRDLELLWIYLIEKQGINRNHLLEYIQKPENSKLYNKIMEEINNLYPKGIFILKNGDLENYLSISKDLNNVILFCQDKFDDWIKNEQALGGASKVLELETIFKAILQN